MRNIINTVRRGLIVALTGIMLAGTIAASSTIDVAAAASKNIITLENIPSYDGSNAFYVVNQNAPYFTAAELTTTSFASYSQLDSLGRSGVAYGNIGLDIMPTVERGAIGAIKPSGWHTISYELIDGRYLYNRCHLIGYQLAGENANEKNLITGTRYLNVTGMLPFENQVADYVQSTGYHVLYRVTPVYESDELVARGVLMEALSVEDGGAGVSFNVFCYNVQPGININYANGDSIAVDGTFGMTGGVVQSNTTATPGETIATPKKASTVSDISVHYIANKNTKKFHKPECSSVGDMKEKNKLDFNGNREDLIVQGYKPCKRCNP